mgnify:CR=1 FL=1
MPILADLHMHSSYSTDSNAPMEEMILSAINKGLRTICFTEHIDLDFPETPDHPAGAFNLNPDAFLYEPLCTTLEISINELLCRQNRSPVWAGMWYAATLIQRKCKNH